MKKIFNPIQNEHFSGCDIPETQSEGRLIAVNEKFLAMQWKKKDQIIIVDSSKPIQIPTKSPYLKGKSIILDLEFSPFNNNILASGHSDKSVLLWNIPKEGLTQNITDNNTIYNKHNKKVNFINFNPIASDVICSSTNEGEIHIWSVEKRDNFIDFKTDSPTMVSWNQNGNLIGATTKNNHINIFDPRNKYVSLKKQIDNIESKFVWNDDNLFSTINSPKGGEIKMLYLWDIKKLNKEVDSIIISKNKNTCIPFVNRELKLIYTIEKDDKKIRIFDYNEKKIKKLKSLECDDNFIYSVLFNRKCLDNKNLEIDRFARYSKDKKSINYISIMINNKEEFGDNLFPKAQFENEITYDQWIQKEPYDLINEEKYTNENFLKNKENEIKELKTKLDKLNELKELNKQLEKIKEEYEKLIIENQETLDNTKKELESKIKLIENINLEKQKINDEKNKKNEEIKILQDKNNQLMAEIELKNKNEKKFIDLNEKYNEINNKNKDIEKKLNEINEEYIKEKDKNIQNENKINEINKKNLNIIKENELKYNEIYQKYIDEINKNKENELKYNELKEKYEKELNNNKQLKNDYNNIFNKYSEDQKNNNLIVNNNKEKEKENKILKKEIEDNIRKNQIN